MTSAADDICAAFGAVVRERRMAKKLTLLDVAERSKVSCEMVRKIENGWGSKRGGTVWTFVALAEAVGMTPSRLMAAVEKRARNRRVA